MKQKLVIILIIIIFILACCMPHFFRYQLGYFEKGGTTNYPHYKDADIVTLDNGNLLLIGDNTYYDTQNNGLLTPFEIYSPVKNKFEEVKFDTGNLLYYPKGIILNDNKLLLTYVSKPPKQQYDSMAIINLNSGKVEKIYKKKINIQRHPELGYPKYREQFVKLDNGKVFIINFANPKTIIEIYNPKTNSSKLLNIDINKDYGSKVISIGKNKVLIFGPERNNKNSESTEVLEYDDTNETVKVVGKITNGKNIELTKLNDNEIFVLGTVVEVYDIKNNSSKFISKENSKKYKKFDNIAGKWTYSLIPINEKYMLITGGATGRGSLTIYRKSTEILDLKTGKFYTGPDMHYKRAYHHMIKLNNDKFFVIDSGNKDQGLNYEIFKPKNK